MTFVHDDYLKYEIPSDWCAEENEDTLLIYDPDGEGAIVTSFFSLMDADVLLEERICIMAKEFIDNNLIYGFVSFVYFAYKFIPSAISIK